MITRFHRLARWPPKQNEGNCVGCVHSNENGSSDRTAGKAVTRSGLTNWGRLSLHPVLYKSNKWAGEFVLIVVPMCRLWVALNGTYTRNRVSLAGIARLSMFISAVGRRQGGLSIVSPKRVVLPEARSGQVTAAGFERSG